MYRKIIIFLTLTALLLAACSPSTSLTQIAEAAPTESSTAVTEQATATYLPTVIAESAPTTNISYPIVDTGQGTCYDDSGVIDCPTAGEAFYGQDAQFTSSTSSYTDNGDGTVTDNVTGLVWQQSADTDGDGDINAVDKLPYTAAETYCENLPLAGYDDWQLPTIKQLYSLMDFTGVDPSGYENTDTSGLIPFIDTDYFDFAYGDTDAGERIIDSQYASSNLYVDGGLLFGVNFADGRIKDYGLTLHGQDKTFTVACMRENSTYGANDSTYGANDFVDNSDYTITDNATGLMWAQNDSGSDYPDGLNWEEALAYVEAQNAANYLGYSDWRLPDVKELQSIVDYGRSPDTTNSAAINLLFNTTPITNEAGETDYGFYWSGTTHVNWTNNSGSAGAYVSFGRAMGYMNSEWSDVHGAGAQRSDPKSGDPNDWPTGNGPQGDAIRIYNTVRLVRDGDVTTTSDGDPTANSAVIVVDVPDSSSTALSVDQAFPAAPPTDANSQPQPAAPPTNADSQPAGPDGQQIPDLATAATQLGVTEEVLMAALGDPGQGAPDFAAAAATLGVTEADLMAALGVTKGGLPPGGPPPSNRP